MTALILEGGGMRTAFTAGVLDYFIDRQLTFNNIIGVSTGAYCALSYLSKQRERTINLYLSFCKDMRYRNPVGMLGILRGRGKNIASILEDDDNGTPFNYEQYLNNEASLTAVATNCITGEATYFPTKDLGADKKYAITSASFPLISSTMEIGGIPFLDGCITDPLSVEYALKQGYKKYIFILTEDRAYYKDKTSMLRLIRKKYRQYPSLIEAFECQHIRYNQQLEMVYCLERMGQALILQPNQTKVSVFEKNPRKVYDLYHEGYFTALKNYDTIINYTSSDSKPNV